MLFDSSDEETEEVSLRTPDDEAGESEDDTNLHNEVETRLGSVTEEDSSSTGSSTRTSGSGDVSLRDIKKQNEQIISLLQDIKNSGETSDSGNSDVGGDPTELL